MPWIVVAGIVTSAVGDDLTLGEPHDTPSLAVTCVLIGGAALFLFGALLFEEGALGKWSRIRFAGLAATLLLIPIAPHCSVLILSALTTTILVGVAAAEHIWINRKRTGNKNPAAG